MDPITWTVSLVSELCFLVTFVYLESISLGRSHFSFPYQAQTVSCGQMVPYTLAGSAQVTALLPVRCKSYFPTSFPRAQLSILPKTSKISNCNGGWCWGW